MIKTLNDLVRYTKQKSARIPVIAEEIELKELSPNSLSFVASGNVISSLPLNYVQVANKLSLKGVSIGTLRLYPYSKKSSSLQESIVDVNTQVANPYIDFYVEHDLVEVANLEADIVCIRRANSLDEGTVFLISTSAGLKQQPRELASSFEELLILRGNMDDVLDQFNDVDAQVLEFRKRLKELGVRKDLQEVWMELLSMELLI